MKQHFTPSSKVIGLLKAIRKKGKVHHTDLVEICKLDSTSIEFLVSKLSDKRRNLLLKHIASVPQTPHDDQTQFFEFAISRKESLNSNMGGTNSKPDDCEMHDQ